MMNVEPDGKIRVRCPNCNKRLKFPAEKAGTVYNCPICGATIISPLDGASHTPPQGARTPSQGTPTPPKPPRNRPQPAAAQSSETWAPTRMFIEPNQAIEKLCRFLARQNTDIGKAAHGIVAAESADISAADLMKRFTRLRAERGLRLQEFVEKLRDHVADHIQQIEHHPMRDQGNIRRQLRMARKEQRDLEAFISVFLMGKTSPGK